MSSLEISALTEMPRALELQDRLDTSAFLERAARPDMAALREIEARLRIADPSKLDGIS